MEAPTKIMPQAKSTVVDQHSGFFTWDNWPYFLAALSVLILVLLIFFLYKRRKGSKDQPEPSEKIAEKGPPISRLAKVWKEFMREIPWEFRRAIRIYDHFIVFGQSGSGKSLLIDNYTDWEGHARQFYPSYTKSPLLQVYLGSKVVIQEIPADLLNDTSKNTRQALLRLWKPLFRRKDPKVVIALNGAVLQTDESSHRKEEAQMLRGKINLLARIRRKPVKVCFALTHMDHVEGFDEFSQFLSHNNIPLELKFSSKDELNQLTQCLEPYEDHLTRALLSLPADKYLNAITFLRRSPRLLKNLSVFVRILQSPDPLTPTPEVDSLCLASRSEEHTFVSNPFISSVTARELQMFNPNLKHRIAAAALVTVGLVYLGTSFFYEHNLIEERYREMAVLEASPPAQYDENMHRLFIDPMTSMQKHTLMTVLPDFFPHINRELDRRCIENIRKFYIFPEIQRFSMETVVEKESENPLWEVKSLKQDIGEIENAQNKLLYLLALTYATRHNGLGKLISKNLVECADILELPVILIKDYISNNDSSWPVSLSIENVAISQKMDITDDPHSWMLYFAKLSRMYQRTTISKTEFRKLKRETLSFLDTIHRLERYDLSVKISELLKKESPLGVTLDMLIRKNEEIRQGQVKNFLMFLKESSIKYPKVTDELNIAGLLENLKVMLHFKGLQGVNQDQFFHFIFAGEEFKFTTKRWNELLNRSRITFLLRDFVTHNKRHDGLLFFTDEKEFDDLVMNPSNDGGFFFTGHARVDGRFTKDAFEKRVKPVMTEFPEFLASLPILKKDKDRFSDFLFKEVGAFGQRYADAYRNYYMDFDIEAQSENSLRYVLNQLTLPYSPFMEVLLTVRDNTSLDLGESEFLRTFVLKLGDFEFFQRLMAEQKGAFPELDKYKAILDQMKMDIENPKPRVEKAGNTALNEFRSRLTPLGKISFSILLNEEDSYYNMIGMWIKSVGISAKWQDIFFAPVHLAYYMGMMEIAEESETAWQKLRQTDIMPLHDAFPFNRESTKEASMAVIKRALHPQGHFWETFHTSLGPLCIEENGIWRERSGPLGIARVPERMLTTVNTVGHISATLWNSEGDEQPLNFHIRPIALPRALPHEPIAVLSYFHSGQSSIFGFNQKPSWKEFEYHWHTKSEASVGVEFTTRDESASFQKTVSVPKSGWNFYRLLQKAESYVAVYSSNKHFHSSDSLDTDHSGSGSDDADEHLYMASWLIPVPEVEESDTETVPINIENRTIKVKYAIRDDPWALFELPE